MGGSKMEIQTKVGDSGWSGGKIALAIVGVLLLVLLPVVLQGFVAMSFLVRILAVVGIYVMLALGLNIVVGYAGLLDLGYIAFYAMGAYSSAIVGNLFVKAVSHIGAVGLREFLTSSTFIFMLPVAALIAALTGISLGTPVLRLRGDYLAIVTLGFGELIRILATNNFLGLTNGAMGMSINVPNPIGLVALQKPVIDLPALGFSFQFSVNLYWYYVVVLLICLTVFVVRRLDNSRLGRTWVAMREDEVAAASVGVNIRTAKLWAFALGALWGGLAGVVFANFQGFITPDSFSFLESAFIVCMVVLGGMGSIPGVIIGASLIAGIPSVIQGVAQSPMLATLFHIDAPTASAIANYRYLLFGLIMIIMMAWRPQGILPSKRRARELHPEDGRTLEEEDQSLWAIEHGVDGTGHDL